MQDRYWRPITIESIYPELFPAVALYLKTGTNYVLYKDPDRLFTMDDRRRLERTATEFLYVRSGDMDELNRYFEANLDRMLSRDDLGSRAKGKILYQTSVNCVIDMFESPETSANLARCRKLVQHLLQYVTTEPKAFEPLKSVIDHNFYIFTHSVQVAALSLLAHEELFNVEADEMQDVGVGGLVHDYGMIFITSEVLEKPDALSDVEYYKVKQHTQKGYEFLRGLGVFGDVALHIVRYHHERYDGNGYPSGLKGDIIPRSAQVAALSDVYSALTMDRSYRKAVPHSEAVKTIREEARQGVFNKELVEGFVDLVNARKAG
jgi:HD-GYP domain-containing protein (c-di-GMP phosphodiesterase class II)